MSTQHEKAERFKALHEREGTFVLPNPWDVGSARILTATGFEALATTSSGMANSLGKLDGTTTFEELLLHSRSVAEATELPLSVDAENAFADPPEEAAKNLLEIAGTGAVGGSIEDFTRDPSNPIYDFDLAVERVQAAAEAVHGLDFPFTLTARAENYLHGRIDLDDTLRRLQAYQGAGADVLYAPGLKSMDDVRAVVGALSKPVNVLAVMMKGVTVSELAEAGVRRISIGGALSRAAAGALLNAAREMLEEGSFAWTANVASGAEVDELLQ